jgi:hypothetical protein
VVRRARALGRGLRRLGGALRTALVTRGTSVAILGPDAVARSTLAAGLASGLPPATRLVPAHPVWRRWSVAPHRLRGRTVVFDGHVPRRADVVIVLDLPGSAEASARPNLSQGHGERAVHVVRADRPRDEVLADVTEIVWRAWTAGRPRARRTPE